MTDQYPLGLPEDREELWRACDATVHIAQLGDGAKQFALFIRQQLRLEASLAMALELVNHVRCTEFEGIACDDINGQNWFDAARQLFDEVAK
jgi:hypothetical protein